MSDWRLTIGVRRTGTDRELVALESRTVAVYVEKGGPTHLVPAGDHRTLSAHRTVTVSHVSSEAPHNARTTE